MRRETMSVHGDFAFDPATKVAPPPIYQHGACGFDSADHAEALHDPEEASFQYIRIANLNIDVLERRVSNGCSSIVAPPQRCGTSQTLLGSVSRLRGIEGDRAAIGCPRGVAVRAEPEREQ